MVTFKQLLLNLKIKSKEHGFRLTLIKPTTCKHCSLDFEDDIKTAINLKNKGNK